MDPFLGEIIIFAGSFPPVGWALCNGQLLNIAEHDALYAIIGTTYGGDGITTFGLPNLSGRVPIHQGQSPGGSTYALGAMTGTETVTLTPNQMPAHVHAATIPVSAQIGTLETPSATSMLAQSAQRDPLYGDPPSNTPPSGAPGHVSGVSGGSQPHDNMQPFLAVNFIIAIQGIFPSRN